MVEHLCKYRGRSERDINKPWLLRRVALGCVIYQGQEVSLDLPLIVLGLPQSLIKTLVSRFKRVE